MPDSTSTRTSRSWPRSERGNEIRPAARSRCRRAKRDAWMPTTGSDEQDADHRAEPGAGRDAENIRRHQRIAEQGLVGRAGPGQRRADEARGHHPRQPDIEQDRCGGAGIAVAEQPVEDGCAEPPAAPERYGPMPDATTVTATSNAASRRSMVRVGKMKFSLRIVEQAIEIRVGQIDLVEQMIERADLVPEVARRLVGIEAYAAARSGRSAGSARAARR